MWSYDWVCAFKIDWFGSWWWSWFATPCLDEILCNRNCYRYCLSTALYLPTIAMKTSPYFKKFTTFASILFLFLLLSWCWSKNQWTVVVKTITLPSYQFSLPEVFESHSVTDLVNPKLSWKIIAVYSISSLSWYADNVVIAQDVLAPNSSLDDYVQASIGGISRTWGNYTALNLEKSKIVCNALSQPIIVNTFQINRIIPKTSQSELLYFVQLYIRDGAEVTTISASTSNKKNVSIFQDIMRSISCRA